MVHLRINEREPNPNPHINFITVLPMGDPTTMEAARQLLRALAAQVKPIMKAHGFVVNSLEEYEYNSVFAGRNWNHGETVELVLRSSTGSLLPTHWLMSTLCHELAHIKHMNHGSAFQALWQQLQQEVRALQTKGYYGDGYWSSGIRLTDSAKIAGQDIEMGGFPEYMCGGAHSRARPVLHRSHKPRGPRTSKGRKPGARVKSDAFDATGRTLNEGMEGESKSQGVGFRKKARSKRAREERAVAAEQRIRVLQSKGSSSKLPTLLAVEGDSASEDEKRDTETDFDRRRTLLEVIEEKELDTLRTTMFDSAQDFVLPSGGPPGNACGVEEGNPTAIGTFGVGGPAPSEFSRIKTPPTDEASIRPTKKRRTSQSKLIFASQTTPAVTRVTKIEQKDRWDCVVCTLVNEANHLACSACGTPRGESKWVGESQGPL